MTQGLIEDFSKYPILYVDDEQNNLELFEMSFADEFTIRTATSAQKGLEILENEEIGLILTDERMPKMTGIEFLEKVNEKWPNTVRIIISAYSDASILLRAINNGHAHEYIVKPWELESLKQTIMNSLVMVEKRKALLNKAKLTDVLQDDLKIKSSTGEIIGKSKEFKELLTKSQKIAATDAPVLIRGETGSGKEVIARLIHESSKRAKQPFIKVNCASISEGVLESELFGHERGAFTNAHKTRIGRFELANTGTILLDEIGDISPKLQLNLLRVLQEQEFERVGGNRTIKVNVRIIAATHQNLEELVKQGRFRSDLFFRINVVPLYITPLKDRKEDVEALFIHFVNKYKDKYLFDNVTYDKNIISNLQKYDWPGNVRELENMIQRAIVMCNNGNMSLDDFGFNPVIEQETTLLEQLKNEEEKNMREALIAAAGNISRASRVMNMPRSTFVDRAKKIGLW